MTLFDREFYLQYLAFSAWREDYAFRQALARYRGYTQTLTDIFDALTQAINELTQMLNEIDWDELEEDDNDDPAGRVDWKGTE